MMATRAEEGPRLPGAGERVLQGNSRWGILPFLGPAFIACVAYMDPGNFATNIAGGSKFGFTLVWVSFSALRSGSSCCSASLSSPRRSSPV